MSTEYNPEEYPQILRDFANYKAVIQGCSPRTINEYMLDIRTFCRFISAGKAGIKYGTPEFEQIPIFSADIEFFENIRQSDIYDFLFFCERNLKNAPAARARKLSAIKSLYKYLSSKRSLLKDNPSADIEAPKKRQALPKFLTYEESMLLLDTVRNDSEARPKNAALRNFTMITLFLNCGMRLSELVGINMGDIDRQLRSVRVIGKGNKERIIYLNDACKRALEEYLPIRLDASYSNTRSRALFLSSRGERISNRAVQWTVEKYLDKAGLGYRHLSVHKLRHTAATLMYQKGGVDVRVLKEILGHEQLGTTQIYTHVSN
ncbi:MAG: tyrosine recombinase XerC [Clostridia bacterium]|nr:tyrosine recombinase XerC [Clostridia bacterium]